MAPVTRTYRLFSMLLITSLLLILIAPLIHMRCEMMSAFRSTPSTQKTADTETPPPPCHGSRHQTIVDAFVRSSCCCDVNDAQPDFTAKATPEKDGSKRKLLPSIWIDVVAAETTLEPPNSNSKFPPIIEQAEINTVKDRYLLYAALLI